MTPFAGILPGTFNPPTVAHLEMAQAARRQAHLDRVDVVLSRVSLGKEDLVRPTVEERAGVLRRVAERVPWLTVCISDHQLVSDLAEGYDVLVVGADKWRQLHDPSFYASAVAHAAALAKLPPRVLVAPRDGDVPAGVELLVIDEEYTRVSSTQVRNGATHLMLPEAAASGLWPAPA
jgi:nicotinic acid mononucleotide adenylyltransferase